MASRIIELFGYSPQDPSAQAREARRTKKCPFTGQNCSKSLSDGELSGVCSLQSSTGLKVICCPIRLYADNHRILAEVATLAFGKRLPLCPAHEARGITSEWVAVFGKGWGKELRLPSRGKQGAYFVDWVLARIDRHGDLTEFVAVEVQSIDTTGNYRNERDCYLEERDFTGQSTAGFNWENVNKRILPQLIYKGHVLRQEPLCRKGLFFVCPTPVYRKICERLGNELRPYPIQPGALTMLWYDISSESKKGTPRLLSREGVFTTTIDQIALAFTSPSNLPPAKVYEEAIRETLGRA